MDRMVAIDDSTTVEIVLLTMVRGELVTPIPVPGWPSTRTLVWSVRCRLAINYRYDVRFEIRRDRRTR
jgi:hypothetical protein